MKPAPRERLNIAGNKMDARIKEAIVRMFKKAIVARFIAALFLITVCCPGLKGQYSNRIYFTDTEIHPDDSNRLSLSFAAATFINNKEFFNPYQPGYTLTGFMLRPALEYHPGPHTRVRAGVHLLKYSGLGKFDQVIPVFTFHHRFAPGIEMVAGSIYGHLNHNLIEPLFTFERVFTDHNESGLQFLIDRGIFKGDIWLNWEKFIFRDDPFQEEFTAGVSSALVPLDRDRGLSLEIPLQLLVTHKGGQIDASGERLQTLVNFALGAHIEIGLDHPFIKSAGFRGYIAGFSDLSNELRYPYENGLGIYPNLIIKTKWGEAGAGYWHGQRFVAPRGEPVFQSVSQVDPAFASDSRQLVTSKIIINRSLARGIDLALRFEAYYDAPAGQFDHTGGLHVIIDDRFFITRVQRR